MKIPNPLSLIVFGLLGIACFIIAWHLTAFEGMFNFSKLIAFIGLLCVLVGLWSNSDFKRWK